MRSPAFQFYPDEFMGGTSDMTQQEVGAYILLLCHQWNRGSIPVEPERNQMIAKGDVSAHVLKKFTPGTDGLLRNERLEIERQKQLEFRERQRLKGIASGKSRNHGSTTVQPETNHGSTTDEPSREPEGNSPSPSPDCSLISTPYIPLKGEKEDEVVSVPKKGPLQLRAEALFRRRPETPQSDKEKKAFKKAKPAIEAMSEDDWNILEEFYGTNGTFHRKDLTTLLNNWNEEIDRARQWKAGAGGTTASERIGDQKALERLDRELDELKRSYDSHAVWSTEDVTRHKALSAERVRLLKKLGLLA